MKTGHLFSTDIGMVFGIKKCAVRILKRGKIIQCDGVKLPDYQEMKQMEEGGCKYLGILEGDQIMEKEMKEVFRKEYPRRLKLVLKSVKAEWAEQGTGNQHVGCLIA